jgi:hypothetical protein
MIKGNDSNFLDRGNDRRSGGHSFSFPLKAYSMASFVQFSTAQEIIVSSGFT